MAAKTKKRSAKPNAKAAGGITPKKASKEELLHYYREMLMIRRFEEKAGQLYGLGLIGGFCHLYIGQAAVVVGMQATIAERDAVISSRSEEHTSALQSLMRTSNAAFCLTNKINRKNINTHHEM